MFRGILAAVGTLALLAWSGSILADEPSAAVRSVDAPTFNLLGIEGDSGTDPVHFYRHHAYGRFYGGFGYGYRPVYSNFGYRPFYSSYAYRPYYSSFGYRSFYNFYPRYSYGFSYYGPRFGFSYYSAPNYYGGFYSGGYCGIAGVDSSNPPAMMLGAIPQGSGLVSPGQLSPQEGPYGGTYEYHDGSVNPIPQPNQTQPAPQPAPRAPKTVPYEGRLVSLPEPASPAPGYSAYGDTYRTVIQAEPRQSPNPRPQGSGFAYPAYGEGVTSTPTGSGGFATERR